MTELIANKEEQKVNDLQSIVKINHGSSHEEFLATPGRYGPVYHINETDRIRTDYRGKIVMEYKLQDGSYRSHTFYGDDALKEAFVKAREVNKLKEELKNVYTNEVKTLGIPFNNYANRVLKKLNELRPASLERYEIALRLHISKSPIFLKDIRKIKGNELRDFLRDEAKQKSDSTAEICHVVLIRIFDEAVEDKIISSNPARGLRKRYIINKKTDRDRKITNCLSRQERDDFISAAKQICKEDEVSLVELMAFGGFRLGEALAMRVKHFNFENLTYRVCETLTKAQDFAPAKCSSERTVHLPSFVMDSVEKYVNKRKLTGSDLLFVDSSCPKGLPYTQRKVQYFFSKVCKKAGLKDNSPHVLRHTYATILLMAHQSIDFVRMQLGHSSIKTTVDQYGHWIPAEGRYNLEGALTGVITGAVPPQINEN